MVSKILAFLIIISAAVTAQNIEEVFASANRMYQQKQYDKSVQLYEELVNEGYEGVSLIINLGNAYYRLGIWVMLYYIMKKHLNLLQSMRISDTIYGLPMQKLQIS
jgi:hypothetical protein